MVRLSLLPTLGAFATILPSILASQFVMTQCNCGSGGFGYVRSLTTSFNQPDGQYATVEFNYACREEGRPDSCAAWQLIEGCGNTGICGVGEICYNQEVFDSDTFKINNVEYEKNSFTNTYYRDGGGRCENLCSNWGMRRPSRPEDKRWVIEGFPQPQACS